MSEQVNDIVAGARVRRSFWGISGNNWHASIVVAIATIPFLFSSASYNLLFDSRAIPNCPSCEVSGPLTESVDPIFYRERTTTQVYLNFAAFKTALAVVIEEHQCFIVFVVAYLVFQVADDVEILVLLLVGVV